jgi:hypothetical protein
VGKRKSEAIVSQRNATKANAVAMSTSFEERRRGGKVPASSMLELLIYEYLQEKFWKILHQKNSNLVG